MSERNWAGNVTYRAREILRPASVEELAVILAREPRVRVLGSRHSFTGIADTDGVLVSLAAMPGEVEVDAAAGLVRVPAGWRHGELVPALDAAGLALVNLASLPHISVAGAVQTARCYTGIP